MGRALLLFSLPRSRIYLHEWNSSQHFCAGQALCTQGEATSALSQKIEVKWRDKQSWRNIENCLNSHKCHGHREQLHFHSKRTQEPIAVQQLGHICLFFPLHYLIFLPVQHHFPLLVHELPHSAKALLSNMCVDHMCARHTYFYGHL